MIRTGAIPGRVPTTEELAAETHAFHMSVLENIAADGFPRASGTTITTILENGWVRRLKGRVPYELTVAGIDTLLAHRKQAAEVTQ